MIGGLDKFRVLDFDATQNTWQEDPNESQIVAFIDKLNGIANPYVHIYQVMAT